MRVVSDRAKAPPAAMRIKRSAMTLCAPHEFLGVSHLNEGERALDCIQQVEQPALGWL
jgi:hypothetical protein